MSTATIGGYYQNHGAVVGGFDGSLGRVQTYVGSAHESAHEKLVRSLAKELKTTLKVPRINPDEPDLNKLCKDILANLPVEKNGQKVRKDDAAHRDLTRKLAAALNRVYGSNILNPDQDPSVVSTQILELLQSLCAGMHGEYASMKGEVKRVIKNLKDLRILLDRNYQALLGKIEDSDDQTLKSQSRSIRKVYDLLKDECDRQVAILQNLFKTVVEPTDLSVAQILNENKDLQRIIKKVKGQPGTQAYTYKLMYGLAGAGNVALMASEVKRALHTIGMSLADYAKAKDIKSLEAAANKLMEKKLDLKNPKLTEIGQFMNAVDVLRRADYHRDDIANALKTGGAVVGGRYKGVDRRIKKRRKLRDSIFRGYNAELSQHFDTMVLALERVTKDLQKSMVITTELDEFVSALSNIPDVGKRNIYYSLAGYIDDAQARARREFFMNQLHYVKYVAGKLLKMEIYRGQHAEISQLSETVDRVLGQVKRFKTYFESGWKIATPLTGRGEDNEGEEQDEQEEQKEQDEQGEQEDPKRGKLAKKQGAGLKAEADAGIMGQYRGQYEELFNSGLSRSDIEGGALDDPMPQVTKSAYKLREVLDQMRYFYNLAKTRYNLSKAASEVKEAAEDYNQILGDGIGKKLEVLTQQYNRARDEIEQIKAVPNSPLSATAAGHLQAFEKDVFEVKRDMYRVAEAVEVYLVAFSDAISNHPDEVQSLKSMLDSVNLAAKWFNNQSGDRLCEVFDSFPGELGPVPAVGSVTPGHESIVPEQNGDHYFDQIANAIQAAPVVGKSKLPGIPCLPIDIEQAKEAKKKADKAVRSLAVLKNLVSAFISIGSKFADAELRKKTNMTTQQIYQALNNYLWVSAFVHGLNSDSAGQTSRVIPYSNMAGVMPAGASLRGGSLVIGHIGLTIPPNPSPADPIRINNTRQVTMDLHPDHPQRLNPTFDETDRLFMMVIKCLVTKPLTVVGVYNMFNRPEIRSHNMDATRLYLGGQVDTPKVESKLMPLYIRLPLLAEFYREVFNFDGFSTSMAISMVPEVDGLFSAFIELMFEQTKHVQRGFYSESQVKGIVEEVNRIYSRFGSKKETVVMDIINEFVAEINRRYGIVENSDRDSYQEERRRMFGRDADYNVEPLDDDYPILEGEDDPNVRMPAPSDAYVGITTRNYTTDAELDLNEKNLINEFRRKIDRLLYRQEHTSNSQDYQFNSAIYHAQQELSALNGDEERFKVVLEAVQGIGRFLRHGGVKVIAFGELVVNSLNLLGALYTQLNKYREIVTSCNLGQVRDDLIHILGNHADIAPGAGGARIAAAIDKQDTDQNRADSLNQSAAAILASYTNVAGHDMGLQGQYGVQGGVFVGCTVDFAPLNGLNVSDFQADVLSASAQNALNTLLNAHLIHLTVFERLHLAVFGQETDLNKMVQVRVVDAENNKGQLVIDHANLKAHIESLFKSTKELLDKFRGSIPRDDLVRFEREDLGSLYFLEEKLLDEFVKGGDLARPVSLDRLDGFVTDAFDVLKSLVGVAGQNTYDTTYNEMVYGFLDAGNNNRVPFGNLGGVDSILGAQAIGIKRSVPVDAAGIAVDSANVAGQLVAAAAAAAAGQYTDYNLDSGFNGFSSSVFHRFNELLYKYLNLAWDPSARKVYRKALDNLAGGVFSSSLSDPNGHTYDDMAAPAAAGAAAVYALGSLPADIDKRVLTRTNALIMRELLNASTTQAQPAYVILEMADVPSHMKDRYRANFPFIVKIADTIIREIELYKGYLAAGIVYNNVNPSPDVLRRSLDNMAQGLFSLRNSAADVLKELDDQPKYLEVSEGSIDYYRSMYGENPIMPISSTSVLLGNRGAAGSDDAWHRNILLPFRNQGTSGFKFRYGCRQLLGRPGSQVSLDHMPWMKDLIQAYNGVSDSRSQVDPNMVSSHLQRHIELLRYYADSRHIRGKMNYDNQAVRNVGLAVPASATDPIGSTSGHGIHEDSKNKRWSVYSIQNGTSLSDVLAMTESTFSENTRLRLAQSITAGTVATSRQDVAVRNLLDLSIVPINIRALMREVVLINIYNCSYTWDHMVADMFGYHPASNMMSDTAKVASSALLNPKDVFVRLLVQPYQPLDMGKYYTTIPLIMSGLLGLNMGRPKFLADQFYNKSMLGELYPNVNAYITYNGQQIPRPGDQNNKNPSQDQGYGLGPDPARAANTMARRTIYQQNKRQIKTIINTRLAPAIAANPNVAALVDGFMQKLDAVEGEILDRDLMQEVQNLHNAVTGLAGMPPIPLAQTIHRDIQPLLAAAGRAALPGFRQGALPLLFRSDHMTYMKDTADNNADRVAEVRVGANYHQALKVIGKLRFDTKFARNLNFIVMCQRVMRLKLHMELSWNKRIISGTTIVDPKFTESVADNSSYDPFEGSGDLGRYQL